jgi:hypothetical protein
MPIEKKLRIVRFGNWPLPSANEKKLRIAMGTPATIGKSAIGNWQLAIWKWTCL